MVQPQRVSSWDVSYPLAACCLSDGVPGSQFRWSAGGLRGGRPCLVHPFLLADSLSTVDIWVQVFLSHEPILCIIGCLLASGFVVIVVFIGG